MRTLLVLLLMMVAADAQTITDGSDANVPKPELEGMMAAVVRHFRDPSATQFRELEFRQDKGKPNIVNELLKNDRICGLVNAKNKFGGYEGYKKFEYLTTDKTFKIEGFVCL